MTRHKHKGGYPFWFDKVPKGMSRKKYVSLEKKKPKNMTMKQWIKINKKSKKKSVRLQPKVKVDLLQAAIDWKNNPKLKKHLLKMSDIKQIKNGKTIEVLEPQSYKKITKLTKEHWMLVPGEDAFQNDSGYAVSGTGMDPWIKVSSELAKSFEGVQKTKESKKTKSKDRPSPSESATGFRLGTVKTGNDGNQWIITETEKSVKRWVKHDDGDPRKNKPLEKMWKSLSDGKSVIFIYKNGTHKVIKTKTPHEDSIIQKGKEDKDVKAILTAGSSWDSYRELYSKAKQKSVNEVVKHYKKYFPYSFPDFGSKGFLC